MPRIDWFVMNTVSIQTQWFGMKASSISIWWKVIYSILSRHTQGFISLAWVWIQSINKRAKLGKELPVELHPFITYPSPFLSPPSNHRAQGHWRCDSVRSTFTPLDPKEKFQCCGSGPGSGSISQRHGSVDPDPHQNVMDPQHCGKPNS